MTERLPTSVGSVFAKQISSEAKYNMTCLRSRQAKYNITETRSVSAKDEKDKKQKFPSKRVKTAKLVHAKEAVDFLKKIKGSVAIFFDGDADGTCSAAIMLAYLHGKKVKVEAKTGERDIETFKKFAAIEADHYIFLDYAGLDETPERLSGFKGKSILIVDHHPINKDLNKEGYVFINPRFTDPNLYYCTTHLVYDLTKTTGLKGFEWLMHIGAIGDHEIEGTEDEREGTELVYAVQAIKKEDLEKLAKFLSQCKKLDDFLYKEKYVSLKNIVQKEMEKQISLFEISSSGDPVFFELKSGLSITGILSTKLSDLYPKKTIIVYSRKKDGWGASGRSLKFDMGKAFKESAKGIGGGGGHKEAAGAFVTDIEQFKSRLMKILK